MELFLLKYKFIFDYLLPFIFGIGGVKLFDYFFNKKKIDVEIKKNEVETEKSAFDLYAEVLSKLKENNTNILQLERRIKELELLVIEKDKKIEELLTTLNNK